MSGGGSSAPAALFAAIIRNLGEVIRVHGEPLRASPVFAAPQHATSSRLPTGLSFVRLFPRLLLRRLFRNRCFFDRGLRDDRCFRDQGFLGRRLLGSALLVLPLVLRRHPLLGTSLFFVRFLPIRAPFLDWGLIVL